MAHSKEEIVVRRIRIMSLILTPLLVVITGILISVITGSNTDRTQWIAELLLIAVTVTAIVLGIIEYIFQNKAGQASSTVDQKDRQDFLEKVEATWIKDQLDRRFYDRELISLELLDESDVVDNSWRKVRQLSRPLKYSASPQKTSILHAYEASADGGLLILGEPGSGKTIQLLELARDLLRRARENEQKRLPVVLILSSWTAKQSSFEDWLVKELQLRYKMQPPLAQKWVANDDRLLLLLLDGLDEVDIAFRELCVEKLNDYSKNSGVPIVACCQSAAYEVLKKKKPLSLNKAVKLPPLTKKQIGSYISSAEIQLAPSGVPLSYISGEKRPLAPLRVALDKDSILQELAKTPLMLDLLTSIYQNDPEEDFSQSDTLAGKRKQVFKRFVEVTLEHRVFNKYFKGEPTLHWLT